MGNSINLRFLIDEDVPRSTTRVLRDSGFDVVNAHSENHGIFVVRVPDSESIEVFNREVLNAVQEVGENLLRHLAIVEIGKVRLRG